MNEIEKKNIAHQVLWLRLAQLAVNKKIKENAFVVPIHLALGHEAVAVALNTTMRDRDKLLLSHRNIAYNLAREGSLRPIIDEYLLKSTGLGGGKLGSMNLTNPGKGIVYTSSILGNQFAVATGVAMGEKNLGTTGVTFVLCGDGSMEEGSFYESLLMGASLGLPIIFLVENNEWSMATRIDERRRPIDISSLAKSLDIKYLLLKNNDTFQYIEAFAEMVDFSLKNSKPVCIEIKVSTLGDWAGPKSEEYPEGKFINYHSGGSPSIVSSEEPLIKENEEDPIFVLKKQFEKVFIDGEIEANLAAIKNEIE